MKQFLRVAMEKAMPAERMLKLIKSEMIKYYNWLIDSLYELR